MENLDQSLLAAIFMSEDDPRSQTQQKIEEKPPSQVRPFHWFNYLQKERPAELSALNELKQKLQSGKFLSI